MFNSIDYDIDEVEETEDKWFIYFVYKSEK